MAIFWLGNAFILLYAASFAVGGVVRRRFPSFPELSRKSVHILCGLTSLGVPFLVHDLWRPVLVTCAMLAYLVVARLRGGLPQVHDVGRRSIGAYLFPVSILLLILLAGKKPVSYVVAILVLTLSDSAAALVGSRLPVGQIKWFGRCRSVSGTLAFFLVTYCVVQVPLLVMWPGSWLAKVVAACVVSACVTLIEFVSVFGTDNLLVPLGAYFILEKVSLMAI